MTEAGPVTQGGLPLRASGGIAHEQMSSVESRFRGPVDRIALLTMVAAIITLVTVQLGPALIGLKSFSGVDILTGFAPWNDRWLQEPWQSPWVGDSVDFFLPGYIEIYQRLMSGDLPWWSTLGGSGAPLLSAPTIPTLTPNSFVLMLLPTWWAIGAAKLLQLAMAVAGMMLWLRRLGTTWAAGAFAGLLYCSSGFFVAWSSWPAQSSVAATIPLLFWAIERFLALRTARSALLISLVVAWLLLGGFPAVAGHALYAGAAYFLVRCVVELRGVGGRDLFRVVIGGAAAVGLGIAVTAVQLLPMTFGLSETDTSYRDDYFDRTLPFRSLLSVFFPRMFVGGDTVMQGFVGSNPIESYAFLGFATVGLALLAILAGRWLGVARGAAPTLTVIGLLAAALTWKHGFWTDWLSDVPVFANNMPGRLRAMVALVGCALAGMGFNLLFVRAIPQRVRRRLVVGAWVILGTAVVGTAIVAINYADEVDGVVFSVDAGLGLAGLLLVAISFTVAYGPVATRGAGLTTSADSTTARIDPANSNETPHVGAAKAGVGRMRRNLLAITVAAFAAVTCVQAVTSTGYFWPLSNVEDFYPETPGVAAAARATAGDRALLGDGTFLGSSASAHGIRAVTGHTFQAESWKDYLLSLDPEAFAPPGRSPTYPRVSFSLADGTLDNPLLDRLAVSTVLTAPDTPVPGPIVGVDEPPPALQTAAGRVPTTVGSTEVPAGFLAPQALRGIAVEVVAPAGDGVHGIGLTVTVRDSGGQEIVSGTSIRFRWEPGWTQIAVAGEDLGELTGSLSVWVSASARDVPDQTIELGSVSGQVETVRIGSQSDGLRLYYADAALQVWERLTALPRIRWAAASAVIEDPASRRAALADSSLPDSTVVLSEPGPESSGQAAEVSVVSDSGDRVAVDVTANGAGYLVLADSIQSGWAVVVNGEPARLVQADHAFGAVYLPPGSSLVEFFFVGNGLRAGAVITAAALLVVLTVIVGPTLIRGLRRRKVSEPSRPAT